MGLFCTTIFLCFTLHLIVCWLFVFSGCLCLLWLIPFVGLVVCEYLVIVWLGICLSLWVLFKLRLFGVCYFVICLFDAVWRCGVYLLEFTGSVCYLILLSCLFICCWLITDLIDLWVDMLCLCIVLACLDTCFDFWLLVCCLFFGLMF